MRCVRLPNSEKRPSLVAARGFREGHCYQGGTGHARMFLWGKMEVTMSHWRNSYEPAPQHSDLADWVIAATVVLAIVLIAHG